MIDAPPPNVIGRGRIAELKGKFRDIDRELALLRDAAVPAAFGAYRELAMARERLEEASMWATKALCHRYPEE